MKRGEKGHGQKTTKTGLLKKARKKKKEGFFEGEREERGAAGFGPKIGSPLFSAVAAFLTPIKVSPYTTLPFPPPPPIRLAVGPFSLSEQQGQAVVELVAHGIPKSKKKMSLLPPKNRR